MMRLPALLFCLLLASAAEAQTTVATWNIRMASPGDGVNIWPNRKEKVAGLIREVNPDILCMQEVLNRQLIDLQYALPEYKWIAAGRDDGMKKGEAMPVFYRADRYNLLEFDHFWLSEQPDTPGLLGWDAACPRIVTWVCLQERSSGDTLFVFNTHFDHVGTQAREMSATRIVEAADSLAGKYSTIITGDFNSTPQDPAYLTTVKAGFIDSRLASITKPVGPEYTFTGFDISKKPGDRIDYVFIRNIHQVNSYLVRTDHSNGMYYSDHLPVIAEIRIKE